jgi:hypothetical protein
MDTPIIIALLVAVVVVFFGYQWYASSSSRRNATAVAKNAKVAAMTAAPPQPEVAAPVNPVIKEEKMPVVAGQTEQELKAKEPAQSRQRVVTQEPVTYEGEAPANFQDTLRHPEQSFHQPAPQAPGLGVDVSAGRAAAQSTPLAGHQQGFSPEMAQNGGALIGNGMFAYDGMEPTEFSSF